MSSNELFGLEIKQVNSCNTDFKKVFSTNVFIPQELNMSHKIFSYLTGFIKLVETFKKMTNWDETPVGERWGLIIFLDEDLEIGLFFLLKIVKVTS